MMIKKNPFALLLLDIHTTFLQNFKKIGDIEFFHLVHLAYFAPHTKRRNFVHVLKKVHSVHPLLSNLTQNSIVKGLYTLWCETIEESLDF